MSLEETIDQGSFLPLLRFPRHCLEGTFEGIKRGENLREPGLGTRGDAVKLGSQENRGWLWSPLLCGITRSREGGC